MLHSSIQPLYPLLESYLQEKQPPGYHPKASNGWLLYHSPLRPDRHPSFSVKPDTSADPGAFKDHATGEHGSIAELARRLGMEPHPYRPLRKEISPITTTYDYRSTEGVLLFQVLRLAPKGFRQRQPDGRGGWIWGLKDVPLVLYRLPELRAADPSALVFVVEGEKDADRLTALGLVATTSPMGAGKWRESYSEALRDRRVVIIPDNDDPGRRHGEIIAQSLHSCAATVTVLTLPELPPKGDVSNWLDAGGSVSQLCALAEKATRYTPSPLSLEPTPQSSRPSWPTLSNDAFYGLAGDLVRTIDPHTEADPAAVLVTLLIYFGNAVNGAPHALVGSKRHALNLNAVYVGETSKGRKGTSMAEVDALFAKVDPGWHDTRILSGLSSGEGLIYNVRDASQKKDREGQIVDEGEMDKRLLIIEEEFASVLKAAAREGNTLSPILRQAWDSGTLRNLTKTSPLSATGTHISIIGHVTASELRRYLTETESGNGFANRFLWICVRRSKLLPDGGGTPEYRELVGRLRNALDFARKCVQPVQRDGEATELWREVYGPLSDGKQGLFGAVTSRAEAQALRLSVLYAVMNGSTVVQREHLRAALALWQYCEDSAAYIFGIASGDAIADRILARLQETPDGLDNSDIHTLFGRHVSSSRRDNALHLLEGAGKVTKRHESTEGRSRTVYTAVPFCA